MDSALASVADQYDVVVIDCPPQLGFLTISAICAATAVLATVHPQMLDVMSMRQFWIMTSDLFGVVAKAGGNMGYDWMRYLVTRYEPGDGPQNQMVSFMRSMFGEHVLNFPMLKSTAIGRRHYQADALRGEQEPVHSLDVRGEHEACRRRLDVASQRPTF